MAQLTLSDGDVPTASQLNTYALGEGGAWSSFTPAVVQSGSVSATNTRSRYARYGRTIHVSINLSVTGTGTSSNAVTVSLPVTAAANNLYVGVGEIFDSSATLSYRGLCYLSTTTTVVLAPTNSTVADFLGSTGFTAALASGDAIKMSFTYEAAS